MSPPYDVDDDDIIAPCWIGIMLSEKDNDVNLLAGASGGTDDVRSMTLALSSFLYVSCFIFVSEYMHEKSASESEYNHLVPYFK